MLVTLDAEVGRRFVLHSSFRYEVVANWKPDGRDRLGTFRLEGERPPTSEPTLYYFDWAHVSGRNNVRVQVAETMEDLASGKHKTIYRYRYHFVELDRLALFGRRLPTFIVRVTVLLPDGTEGHSRVGYVQQTASGYAFAELEAK